MLTTAQATPASNPATAPAVGNDWLHPSLAKYDSGRNWEHAHQDIEVHGFAISDSTTTLIGSGEFGTGPDQIWVGYGEGRWMAPEAVLELSRALMLVAHAHIQRVYVKQCAAIGIAIETPKAKAQAQAEGTPA